MEYSMETLTAICKALNFPELPIISDRYAKLLEANKMERETVYRIIECILRLEPVTAERIKSVTSALLPELPKLGINGQYDASQMSDELENKFRVCGLLVTK